MHMLVNTHGEPRIGAHAVTFSGKCGGRCTAGGQAHHLDEAHRSVEGVDLGCLCRHHLVVVVRHTVSRNTHRGALVVESWVGGVGFAAAHFHERLPHLLPSERL